MPYTPLYIQTENSLLKSMIRIPELVKYAKEQGFTSLALTDESMFGAMEFYEACLEEGIKPIIGLEVPYYEKHILLYAKNYHGYQNLCRIATVLSKENVDDSFLKRYQSDLICIVPYEAVKNLFILEKIYDEIYIGYSKKEVYETLAKEKAVYVHKISALKKEDTEYLVYLEAIRKGLLTSSIETDYSNDYFLSLEEIRKQDYNPSINEKITESIFIEIPKREGLLPQYETNGMDTFLYLKGLCKEGLKKRFGEKVPKIYIERLKYELEIINTMGFSNYFLIVQDYVKYAKEHEILVGPGRGSAAGSLVSYVLEITDIDPIRYQLLFERFLNPERITMPDIDIDFLDERRDEVIHYCVSKYGLKRASGIITFGTLASKQAVRDVCKCLALEGDTLAKMLNSKYTLEENVKMNPSIGKYLQEHEKMRKAYLIAKKLEGIKRHTSIHAAGVVISSVDLDEVVPLYYHNNMYLCAYSMNYLENLGLLKMDFLALKNLNIIDRILKDLNKDGISLTFASIPLNDPEAFRIFEEVNTIGIFQFESEGMMNFLRKFKPKTFDEIYASLALYRPGPMGEIDTYIKRKEGREKVEYYDARLEEILKPTYGILIYQEQIMQVAHVMASYSLAEADILRRAMSKKKEDVLLREREKFITRSIQNGYTEKVAIEVYELILKFASYGFNKAHSVSYAMISYKMAYLKAHYPAYFVKSLLDMAIGSASATKNYIYEAKKNKLQILPPSIHASEKQYSVFKNQICYPLYNIKGVGSVASDVILEERKKGPFKDIYDFVKRTYSKAMHKGTLTSLILSGCFDCFHIPRKMLIQNLDLILNYAEVITYLDEEYALKPSLEVVEEYTKKEMMQFEYDLFGFYLSNHPVMDYRMKLDEKLQVKDVKNYFDKNISIIVEIKKIKELVTKKGESMCFVTCEDEVDTLDVVIFPKFYVKMHFKVGDIVLLKGHVEKRYDQLQISVMGLKVLEDKND